MKRTQRTVYRGKTQHRVRNAVLCILFVGLLCFSALFALMLSGDRDQISGDPHIMIILGYHVKPSGPSILLQDRLDEALDYLEEHPDMTIVVAGGQGPNDYMVEAQAMYEYLVENGISPEQILREGESHNTVQNLMFSFKMLAEEGYDTTQDMVVVSNGFHLTRVRMLWNRISGGDYNLSTLAAPSTHLPSRVKMYIREPLALVKSFLLDGR